MRKKSPCNWRSKGEDLMKNSWSFARIAFIPFSLSSSLVTASGIYVDSQNAVGVGNANAGAAALAEDSSTVFYNPAGMNSLGEGQFFSGALTAAKVDTEFKNTG